MAQTRAKKPSALGINLARIMKERGLNTADIQRLTNGAVDNSAIGRVIRGETQWFRQEKIEVLAAVLEVEIEDLTGKPAARKRRLDPALKQFLASGYPMTEREREILRAFSPVAFGRDKKPTVDSWLHLLLALRAGEDVEPERKRGKKTPKD